MSDMKSNVVFIGAGNMAEAIVRGMVDASFCAPKQIVLTDVRPERLADLKADLGVEVSTDFRVVEAANVVVLAIKPQVMDDVLKSISPFLCKETLVISIAAGVPSATIQSALGGVRVVRVMPNTPALIGRGAAGIAAGALAAEADLEVAEAILGCVGLTERVAEKDLDAVTAVSGSGPAYVFYLLESMLCAADEMGLDPEAARTLALQTVEGAARLMKETGESAADLRAKVTSKGGTTAAAIQAMERAGVKRAIVDALHAARDRSIELSS